MFQMRLLKFSAFVIWTLLIGHATPAASADFRDGFGDEIVLEGTIEQGDYEKFRSFIAESASASISLVSKSIYLASPGGSLLEAIKIGGLVRQLNLVTIVAARPLDEAFGAKIAERHKLKNRNDNVCASACFFIFAAGVKREIDLGTDDPLLGIHRPYLTDSELKKLSGTDALASASQTKALVKKYLDDMGVPSKYAERMYGVPKDEVSWVSASDFKTDFEGVIPGLREWVAARCDSRSDNEKSLWSKLGNKLPAEMTMAEKSVADQMSEKMVAIDRCGSAEIDELSRQAHIKAFGPSELDKQRFIRDYVKNHPLSDGPSLSSAKAPWWKFWD